MTRDEGIHPIGVYDISLFALSYQRKYFGLKKNIDKLAPGTKPLLAILTSLPKFYRKFISECGNGRHMKDRS